MIFLKGKKNVQKTNENGKWTLSKQEHLKGKDSAQATLFVTKETFIVTTEEALIDKFQD